MAIETPTHPITAEEFLEEYDDRGFELVHGQLQEISTGAEAALIGLNLYRALRDVAPPAGLALGPGFGMQLWPLERGHVRKPDGMYIAPGRLPSIPRGWITVRPDICWEVVSPGDKLEMFQARLEDYRTAAIPLVWVLYPGTTSVHAHYPDGSSQRLGPEDTLTAGNIIPGFAVRVADLFMLPGPPSADS